MNPEFRPGFGVRNAGRPDKSRIDKKRDPALGERTDLADRKRDGVGREGDRLPMKVAAGKRFAAVGEDQRIVGNRVGLGGERGGRVAQEIEAGAHHLRLAAQAIGILHPLVSDQVRSADGASLKKRAQSRGDFDLASMAPERMDARVERRIRAARAIGRERAGRQGGAERSLGHEQARERIGGRELRAVEQRQPLLGLKRDRLKPDFGERRFSGHDAIADARFAHADHRRGHMGERREIA